MLTKSIRLAAFLHRREGPRDSHAREFEKGLGAVSYSGRTVRGRATASKANSLRSSPPATLDPAARPRSHGIYGWEAKLSSGQATADSPRDFSEPTAARTWATSDARST